MSYSIESAPFYYGEATAQQQRYSEYAQNVAMVKDINMAVTKNTDRTIAANALFTESINSRIIDAQIASANTLYNNTQDMIRTFDSGFSEVSRQIGIMGVNMGMAIAALNTTVQESAQAIYDKLDTMNDILNNPSLTKSRELFRRASVNYNKGFFEEARNDLLEALASNKTDYISWFLLGKTYLFGSGEFSTVIDLDASVDALKNAVKFITPDARKQEEARVMAAEMCFYLGLAQQTKAMDSLSVKNEVDCRNYLEQAGRSYNQSCDYSPQMLEAQYNRARCKVFLGDLEGAIADLETVVLADRNYCVKVCADNDFSSIGGQFAVLIKKLKNTAFIPAKNNYDHITTLLSELASLGGTTKATIPSTFTEEIPYFDVLDYAKDFKRIIPIVEKDIADKKSAIAKAKQLEEMRLEKERQAERDAKEAEATRKAKAERDAREAEAARKAKAERDAEEAEAARKAKAKRDAEEAEKNKRKKLARVGLFLQICMMIIFFFILFIYKDIILDIPVVLKLLIFGVISLVFGVISKLFRHNAHSDFDSDSSNVPILISIFPLGVRLLFIMDVVATIAMAVLSRYGFWGGIGIFLGIAISAIPGCLLMISAELR